jgi:hypothetical protein
LVRVTVGTKPLGVAWDEDAPPRELGAKADSADLRNDTGLLIVRDSKSASGSLDLSFGSGLRKVEIVSDDTPLPKPDCPEVRAQQLDFSLVPLDDATLVRIRELGSECRSVAFSPASDASAPSTVYQGQPDASVDLRFGDLIVGHVCIPEELFPFTVGDRMRVSADYENTTIQSADYRLTLTKGYSDLSSLVPADCAPVRDPCGAVWQPMLEDTTHAPGAARVYRALQVVIARRGCAHPFGYLGLWYETAMLKELDGGISQ